MNDIRVETPQFSPEDYRAKMIMTERRHAETVDKLAKIASEEKYREIEFVSKPTTGHTEQVAYLLQELKTFYQNQEKPIHNPNWPSFRLDEGTMHSLNKNSPYTQNFLTTAQEEIGKDQLFTFFQELTTNLTDVINGDVSPTVIPTHLTPNMKQALTPLFSRRQK